MISDYNHHHVKVTLPHLHYNLQLNAYHKFGQNYERYVKHKCVHRRHQTSQVYHATSQQHSNSEHHWHQPTNHEPHFNVLAPHSNSDVVGSLTKDATLKTSNECHMSISEKWGAETNTLPAFGFSRDGMWQMWSVLCPVPWSVTAAFKYSVCTSLGIALKRSFVLRLTFHGLFYLFGATALSGPGPPHSRGF